MAHRRSRSRSRRNPGMTRREKKAANRAKYRAGRSGGVRRHSAASVSSRSAWALIGALQDAWHGEDVLEVYRIRKAMEHAGIPVPGPYRRRPPGDTDR